MDYTLNIVIKCRFFCKRSHRLRTGLRKFFMEVLKKSWIFFSIRVGYYWFYFGDCSGFFCVILSCNCD